MSGLIVGGIVVPVDGHRVVNWNDDEAIRLRIGQDGRPRRTSWIRSIILHTTKGIPGGKDRRPQVIRPGKGPPSDGGRRVARFWSRDPTPSGAHLVVDGDCVMYCLADLRLETAFHATTANEYSIGIEIYQGAAAELYDLQLEAVADLVDRLTLIFGIQRQIPLAYRNRPLERFATASDAAKMCGVFGHRDVTSNRGEGDPGNEIMSRLRRRRYRSVDFADGEDLELCKIWQRELGLKADGIPGPETIAALAAHGFAGGLWALPPAERVA